MRSAALCLQTALLLVACAVPIRAQATRFPGARYAFASSATDVALADVDGDGWLDLLASAGGLGVRLGQVGGAFGPLATYPGGATNSLVVQDLDGDGDQDAIVMGTNAANVLRGNGDGSFGNPTTYSTTGTSRDVAIGDLNDDGQLDLVLLTSTFVQVRLGIHSGFGAPWQVSAPASAWRLALGDLDGDGHLDAAVTSSDAGTVHIYAGVGNGTLEPPVSLAALAGAEPVCVADFDADGALDLAVGSNSLSGMVAILLGHGDGSFDAPVLYDSEYVYCLAFEVADVDRDGVVDLLVTTHSRLAVLPGLGDGTFGEAIQHATGAITHRGIAVGDIDRDGTTDAAVADWEGYDVTILDGVGASAGGMALAAATMLPGPSTFNRGLAQGDFDGDGDLDLFASNEWQNTGLTWLNDGQGSFSLAHTMTVADQVWWAEAGLLDGDAVPDVLTIDRATGTAQSLIGQGDGSFVLHDIVATNGMQPREGALGDLDEDGDLDAAIVNEMSATVSVLLGDGQGSFEAHAQSWPLHGTLARNLVLGDVTGDGHLDVIAAPYNGIEYTLLAGQGDGTFQAPKYFEPGAVSDMALADLNDDGWPDVVQAHYNAKTVTVSLHTGNGSVPYQNFGFPYATLPTDSGGPVSLRTGDFDGDGAIDVAVGTQGTFRIELSFGDGDGGLELRESYAVDETGTFIDTGDWDGNGRSDLLAVAQNISILLERTEQPWTSQGAGMAGSDGIPHLQGEGALEGGDPFTLHLAHARPLSPAVLVVGLDLALAPLKGGVLVPDPDILIPGWLTSAAGSIDFTATWPAAVPPGLTVWMQYWISDPLGPSSFAASGGVGATGQ